MGRKNQIKSEILEVISSSPNGVSPKEIMKEIGCSESALFYNLKQLKEKGKIINKDHKYFEKNSKNKINLVDPRNISGFRSYESLLSSKINQFIKNKKERNFSVINKYEKLRNHIVRFEDALIDTIHISYEGIKPFYLKTSLNDKIIHKIQELICDFIFYPEILLNLNSLSDLDFTFEISFGKGLEKKLSHYNDFSEFKETVIGNWGIFLDEMKFLEQYDQITKASFLKNFYDSMKNEGKVEFLERNEKESIIKKQLHKIKNRIYTIFPVDEVRSIYMPCKSIYRSVLTELDCLDLEDIISFQKTLIIISKIFLNYIESKRDKEELFNDVVNNERQEQELFDAFVNNIKTFMNNYNKKHNKELKKKFGFDIFDEGIPNEIMHKKIFDKIIDNIKNERKKND